MTLMLKLLLAPLLVVGSSLAGRRWGDRVTGMLVAFPIVAGPILLISALDHGTGFGARAAAASLLGLVSLAVFVTAFAYASRRFRWAPALGLSWAATILSDVVLVRLPVNAYQGIAVVLVAVLVAHRLIRRVDLRWSGSPQINTPNEAPWWDLPGRALATAALVLLATGISAAVGPVVTGILAPFPVAISVVATFALAQQGPAAAIRTAAGVVRGLIGFAVFCFLVAVLLVPLGVAAAFIVGLAGTLAAHLAGKGVSRLRTDQSSRTVGSGCGTSRR